MITQPLSLRCGQNEYMNPAIVLEGVVVSDMKGKLHEEKWDAVVDTGADRSIIPLSVCHDLGLSPREKRYPRGFDGKVGSEPTPIFYLCVLVKGFEPTELGVYGIKRGNILLGRDFLKNAVLVMDSRTQMSQIGKCSVLRSALLRILAVC